MKILRREKSVDGVKFILFEKHVDTTIATIPTSISEVTNIVQQQENFDREQYTTLDTVRSEISSSLKNFNIISSPNQFQFPISQPKDNDIIQFDGSLGEIKWSELPSVKNYDVDIQSINNTFAEHKFNFDSSYIKTRTVHFKFDGYARDNGLQWQDHDKPLAGYYGIMMGRGPDFSFSGQATRGGLVGVSNSLVMRSSMSEGTNRGFLWTRTGGEDPGYHPLMALSTSNAMLHIDGGISILRNTPWTSNETLSAITNMPHLNIFFSGLTAAEQDYVVVYKHTIPLSGTDYLNRGLLLVPQSELTGITGGSGESELSGLTDVSLSALTNGHALTYNSATGKWQNSTPSEGVTDHELLTGLSGGSANNHYHLSDLAYSALTSGGSASSYHIHDEYTDSAELVDYVTGYVTNAFIVTLPNYSLTGHGHQYSAITNTGHTHEYSGISNTGHGHDFSVIANTAHTHLYSAITDTGHTHQYSATTNTAHTHVYSAITSTAHTHDYAAPVHTHIAGDIVDGKFYPSIITSATGAELPDPVYHDSTYVLMGTSAFVDGAVWGHLDHGALDAGLLQDNDHPRYSQSSHTHSYASITGNTHTHVYSAITNTAHTHSYSALTETGHTHGLSAMTGTVNWNQIYSAGTNFGDTLISYGDSVAPYGWQSYPLVTALLGKSNIDHTHTFSAITDSGSTLETWLTGQTHSQFTTIDSIECSGLLTAYASIDMQDSDLYGAASILGTTISGTTFFSGASNLSTLFSPISHAHTDYSSTAHSHSFSAYSQLANTGHSHMMTATTRAWDGKICGAYGDGDPGRLLEMCQSNGVVSPTPTNIQTGYARCSYFILQSDLVVNKIRFYGVGNVNNMMRCAIYNGDSLLRLTDELYFNTAAATWGSAGSSLNLTLSAGQLYFIAVATSATSTTAAVLAMGPGMGASTGQIAVLPKSYPGNLNISLGYAVASWCQFTLSSPGTLPTTAATIAYNNPWTGGMPAFWLDNNND